MSTQTPRRRHSPAVYRRRRLGVLLLALLIIGGIVALMVWQPWRAWADAGPSADPATTSTPAASAAASPIPTSPAPAAPSASPSPAPTASAEGSPDDEASASDEDDISPCTTADVTVNAVVDRESYGTGELPQLSIELVNDTELPCLMNVGTSAQTFEITSGSDTWWRSTDCQTEPSDHVVQLEAGQRVTSAAPLVWDRTRSSVETCDSERQSALPGWYNLTVSIGGIEAVEPAQFTLR